MAIHRDLESRILVLYELYYSTFVDLLKMEYGRNFGLKFHLTLHKAIFKPLDLPHKSVDLVQNNKFSHKKDLLCAWSDFKKVKVKNPRWFVVVLSSCKALDSRYVGCYLRFLPSQLAMRKI